MSCSTASDLATRFCAIRPERIAYGEVRLITIGRLKGRMVVVVGTERGGDQHVISMRKANPVSKKPMAAAWTALDDAPDLSAPEWRAKMDAAPVVRPRGRPRSEAPKVATNLRLSSDVLDAFKATGPGWQTRMEAALWDTVDRLGVEDRKKALDDMIVRRKGAGVPGAQNVSEG